jgi:hypothetical protein
MPNPKTVVDGVAALQVTVVSVASSFTTMEVGCVGVSVLLTKSALTDSETSPFGVTGHEQHETNCSSGENAYTFTQRFPVVPAFVMLRTESPLSRLAA